MPRANQKLLLVGWDSADWKIIRPLIAKGELPHLAKLLARGTSGNLATLEPVLSPMLWTSIATGKHAYDHGVHGFTEVEPGTDRVIPVSAATRQCRTLWEMLADHGLKSHVVGWFATQGERTPGVNVVSNLYAHAPKKEIRSPADWPPPLAGTYWPEELGQVLDEFRLHPTEIDRDLMHLFVPRAPEIDQRADPRLYHLAEHLAEAISVHAAATWLMENKPWNLTAVYFRAIDEICHEFMPYHAPKMDGVPDRDFELYHDVVNSAYRLHDLFLARLIALAGEDAAVVLVSDHGFHSDHLRPRYTPDVAAGIVVWHRAQGIFAAAGPGFAQGEELHGARLLDVTPTILRWFELPRGREMEGRVLHEAFVGEPWAEEIATWEKPGSPAGQTATRPRLSEAENRALIDQFVALGYIAELPAQASAAAATTRRENQWQLAQACLHGGRPETALPLLEEVFTACPERHDFSLRLAQCQLQLGLLDEADATLAVALDSIANPATAHLIRANVALQRGAFVDALAHLEAARAREPDSLSVLQQLALAYLKLRRWDDCEATARQVLSRDPEHAFAWVGIARCQLHRGESAAAVQSALQAVSLDYQNAQAHLNLGLGLARLEKWEEAERAFRNATILQPYLIPPHRFLAQALHKLGRVAEADQCLERARGLRGVYDFQKQRQLERQRDLASQRSARRREKRRQARETAGPAGPAPASETPSLEFVLVSGLPRSGTSLMMQMLDAGGLPAMSDHQRSADESNPEGYFEWEAIKQLARDPRIIEQAAGKAIKVISMLLPHLPLNHRYKVIFMRRPIAEIVSSQHRMLARNGRAPLQEAAALERLQTEHVDKILSSLARFSQVEVLEVDYPALVAAPLEGARRVLKFIGPGHLPHAALEKMAATIRPELHRQRSGIH